MSGTGDHAQQTLCSVLHFRIPAPATHPTCCLWSIILAARECTRFRRAATLNKAVCDDNKPWPNQRVSELHTQTGPVWNAVQEICAITTLRSAPVLCGRTSSLSRPLLSYSSFCRNFCNAFDITADCWTLGQREPVVLYLEYVLYVNYLYYNLSAFYYNVSSSPQVTLLRSECVELDDRCCCVVCETFLYCRRTYITDWACWILNSNLVSVLL